MPDQPSEKPLKPLDKIKSTDFEPTYQSEQMLVKLAGEAHAGRAMAKDKMLTEVEDLSKKGLLEAAAQIIEGRQDGTVVREAGKDGKPGRITHLIIKSEDKKNPVTVDIDVDKKTIDKQTPAALQKELTAEEVRYQNADLDERRTKKGTSEYKLSDKEAATIKEMEKAYLGGDLKEMQKFYQTLVAGKDGRNLTQTAAREINQTMTSEYGVQKLTYADGKSALAFIDKAAHRAVVIPEKGNPEIYPTDQQDRPMTANGPEAGSNFDNAAKLYGSLAESVRHLGSHFFVYQEEELKRQGKIKTDFPKVEEVARKSVDTSSF